MTRGATRDCPANAGPLNRRPPWWTTAPLTGRYPDRVYLLARASVRPAAREGCQRRRPRARLTPTRARSAVRSPRRVSVNADVSSEVSVAGDLWWVKGLASQDCRALCAVTGHRDTKKHRVEARRRPDPVEVAKL